MITFWEAKKIAEEYVIIEDDQSSYICAPIGLWVEGTYYDSYPLEVLFGNVKITNDILDKGIGI